jgi:hypothetical protein
VVRNEDYDYADYNSPSHTCEDIEEEEYLSRVWHQEEERIVEWERKKEYVLVAPRKSSNRAVGFQCPQGYDGLSWAPQDIGDFDIISDGSLRGSNLSDFAASPDGSVKITSIWSPDTYCMVMGSPPDYGDYEGSGHVPEEDLTLSFMHCVKPEGETWEEIFISRFHPIALSISIAFLILTLGVYILERGLRETLVGKITMGFIINLAISFTIIADTVTRESDKSYDRRETFGCIISGYLIMYFFFAFFFWLNAMALHIWMPFAPCKVYFGKSGEKTRLLVYTLYAQGLPLVLCCLTAGIDAAGKGKPKSELMFYPEMGVYSCFLGSQRTSEHGSYFTSPVFLYYQSVLIMVQICNLVLLILTWVHLHQNQQGSTKESRSHNFYLFFKLFFILGFHWSAEFLSTAVATEHGWQQTFYVRLILDLVNLFAGVLIFLALICNKQVLRRIQDRLGRDRARQDTERIQMSVVPAPARER